MEQPVTPLARFGARVAYATNAKAAARAVATVLADGALVALDFETTPHPNERERAAALKREKADAKGQVHALDLRQKAARRTKDNDALAAASRDLAEAKTHRALLTRALEHAE